MPICRATCLDTADFDSFRLRAASLKLFSSTTLAKIARSARLSIIGNNHIPNVRLFQIINAPTSDHEPITPGLPRTAKEATMTKVLVLYHSMYGHVEKMAEAVAAGAREVGDRKSTRLNSSH